MTVRLSLVYDIATLSSVEESGGVVLLPELVDGGYEALRRGEGVHIPGDPTLRFFRTRSRLSKATIIAGSVALRDGKGGATNSSLVYQRGRFMHRYDKIHLFRPADEFRLFRPGRKFSSFLIGASGARFRAAVIICYDLRFPELTRFLARDGVEVLCVPARWPAVRDEAWQSLLKARAIENQMFVVGCNALGNEGGYSYVFDPAGTLIFTNRTQPELLHHVVELDISLLREMRSRMKYVDDAVILSRLTFPRGFGIR